jgi:cellulose synthase/poly-beta-1,6-N-acetylglucosamine synthase-like glycosyltransferase
MVFFHWLLLIIQILLALPVAYLLVLTAAAWRAARRTPLALEPAARRFAILVPAHNEELLLPATLVSLQEIDYPRNLFDIHVIADNCSDRTASLARSLGVNVHVRTDPIQIGKGHALNWCLKEIQRTAVGYEAYAFIDADTVVAANFLQVMNTRLLAGAQVLQAYYAVKDPQTSWNTTLRYIALAALHYLRPLGRMFLGGSAGLKGNGMVFTTAALERHPWSGSLTEDIEAHMNLLLDGIPVQFAAEAVVYGEMPATFSQSKSQLDRWEHGRLQMALRYGPQLLAAAGRALHKGQFSWIFRYLDAVMEHLIPPFSVLFSVSAVCLAAAAVFFLLVFLAPGQTDNTLVWANLLLGCALLLMQVIYVISSLSMVGAPASAYRGLLFAPWFVLRKLGQLASVFARRTPRTWIKTTRNDG